MCAHKFSQCIWMNFVDFLFIESIVKKKNGELKKKKPSFLRLAQGTIFILLSLRREDKKINLRVEDIE